MHVPVQNHPGSRCAPRTRPADLLRAPTGEGTDLAACLLLVVSVLSALTVLATALIGSDVLPVDWPAGRAVALGAGAGAVLAGCLAGAHRLAARPVREQRHYHRTRGTRPLSAQQRDWLRPLAWASFEAGLWSQTLVEQPLTGTADRRSRLSCLPAVDPVEYQLRLDEEWGVLNGQDAVAAVDRVLTRGDHCLRFATGLGLGPVDCAERVAGLTRLPLPVVLGELDATEDRPAHLLWGYEAWRAATLARHAHLAGYLNEDTCWRLLERCARVVYALFDSEDEYLTNVLVGYAHACDRLGPVVERTAAVDEYRASDWPMRRLTWRAGDLADLTEAARCGFAAEIQTLRARQDRAAS